MNKVNEVCEIGNIIKPKSIAEQKRLHKHRTDEVA